MSFKTGDEDVEVQVKTRIGQNAPGLSLGTAGWAGQLQTQVCSSRGAPPNSNPCSRIRRHPAGRPGAGVRYTR